MDESGYIVIQFIKARELDCNKYFCVPKSWIIIRRRSKLQVCVKYPFEAADMIEKRLKSGDHNSHYRWTIHSAHVKHETNSYENAIKWISENTPSTVKPLKNSTPHHPSIVLRIPKSKISNTNIQFPKTNTETDSNEVMPEVRIRHRKESNAGIPGDCNNESLEITHRTNNLIANATSHHPHIVIRIPKSIISETNIQFPKINTVKDSNGVMPEVLINSSKESSTGIPSDCNNESLANTHSTNNLIANATSHHPPIVMRIPKSKISNIQNCFPSIEDETDSDEENMAGISKDSDNENTTDSEAADSPPTPRNTSPNRQLITIIPSTPAQRRTSKDITVDCVRKCSEDSEQDAHAIETSLRDLALEIERRNRLVKGLLPVLNEIRSLCEDNNLYFEEYSDSESGGVEPENKSEPTDIM